MRQAHVSGSFSNGIEYYGLWHYSIRPFTFVPVEKIAEEIGKIIAAYRKAKSFSQEELADLSQIHRTYVSQIERGLKYPTIYVLIQISKALEVPLSQLISELEDKIK